MGHSGELLVHTECPRINFAGKTGDVNHLGLRGAFHSQQLT